MPTRSVRVWIARDDRGADNHWVVRSLLGPGVRGCSCGAPVPARRGSRGYHPCPKARIAFVRADRVKLKCDQCWLALRAFLDEQSRISQEELDYGEG